MSTQPKVTIGIPTFNRASLLEEAIESVLSQSYQNIEIIISDNNSEDETERVVKELQKRSGNIQINYLKQSTPIPVVDNWLATLKGVSSTYFGWLQDDDLISSDFIETAVQSMQDEPNATVYCCYAQYAENPIIRGNMSVWGNPFNLNWVKKEKMVLDGHSLIPLSIFDVLGYSPVALFDTKRLQKSSHFITKDYWLWSERMVLIQASLGSKLIFDAKIGGLYRSHPKQLSFINNHKREIEKQREYFLKDLNEIYSEIGDVIFEQFDHHLQKIELAKKVKWRIESLGFEKTNEISQEAHSILNQHLIREKKNNPTYFLRLRFEKFKKLLRAPYLFTLSIIKRVVN